MYKFKQMIKQDKSGEMNLNICMTSELMSGNIFCMYKRWDET